MNEPDAGREFLKSSIARLAYYRDLGAGAIAQVANADLRKPLPGDVNSIAIIVKHLAGNMRSRWTDLLTSDGEKSWRHRDDEFIDDFESRKAIMECWDGGWACVMDALESLAPGDLMKEILIRGEQHTVIDAVHRQLVHYGYHVGQIVLIARVHVGEANWTTLTIPRGGSDAFNRSMGFDAGDSKKDV